MTRARPTDLINIDLLLKADQAESEGEELLTEWRRELVTRRLRPGWLPEPPKSAEKYSENLTELLNEVHKDLKTSILTLQRKKRRVTTILKQIEFKSGKPGRPRSSTLREDAIIERAQWYAAQRKLVRLAEHYDMTPFELECELKKSGKFDGYPRFFNPQSLRKVGYTQLAKILAPKRKVDLKDKKVHRTAGYRSIDRLAMAIKKALQRKPSY